MRKVRFAEGEIYHIYNRGVEKRECFADDQDRSRFLLDLVEMNSTAPVVNSGYFFLRNSRQNFDSDRPMQTSRQTRGERLSEVLAFVLMPNHFHLLLKQRRRDGIPTFMQKLGTAYTMYFNKRWHRTGMLFQGPYRAVHIKREDHYEWISHYIHANPLKLRPPLPSAELQMESLKSYVWTSFRDYAGLGGFPHIVDKTILQELYSRDGGFYSSMLKWLRNRLLMSIEAKPR